MAGPTLLLLAALGGAPGSPPPCPAELFRIGRSKNANVIVYEANLSSPGTLDAKEPVKASWILLAENGQREELSFFEWRMAYGFDVKAAAPEPGFVLTFKAKGERPVRIVFRDGCPVGMTAIGGRMGILRRIYIESDNRYLIPSVLYVDVFGIDPETGEDLKERIVVSAPRAPLPEPPP